MDYEEIMDDEEEIITLYKKLEQPAIEAATNLVKIIKEVPSLEEKIKAAFSVGKVLISMDANDLVLDAPNNTSIVIAHNMGGEVYHFTQNDFSDFAAMLYVRLYDAELLDSHTVYSPNVSILIIRYGHR